MYLKYQSKLYWYIPLSIRVGWYTKKSIEKRYYYKELRLFFIPIFRWQISDKVHDKLYYKEQ